MATRTARPARPPLDRSRHIAKLKRVFPLNADVRTSLRPTGKVGPAKCEYIVKAPNNENVSFEVAMVLGLRWEPYKDTVTMPAKGEAPSDELVARLAVKLYGKRTALRHRII